MITASFTWNGRDFDDVVVLNPGGWFGKTWLLELGGSIAPMLMIVEADSLRDAIDEFSDNETYGHQIHVADGDLGDYPEHERDYDGSGRVIDTEWLQIHGQEGAETPFPCLYNGVPPCRVGV